MPPEAASVELHELDVLEVSWGSSHLRVIPRCRFKGMRETMMNCYSLYDFHCKGGEVVVVVRGRGLACSLVSEKEYEQLGQFTKNYHKPLEENHQSCHKTKTVLCLEFTIWDHSPPDVTIQLHPSKLNLFHAGWSLDIMWGILLQLWCNNSFM